MRPDDSVGASMTTGEKDITDCVSAAEGTWSQMPIME